MSVGTAWSPSVGGAAPDPSTVAVSPEVLAPHNRGVRGWFARGRSVRMRIIMSYVVLLAASAIVSTFALREILLLRLGDRIEAAFDQEILELDRLLADGRDPNTGQPFASLPALYDVYFSRNVPSIGEGMLAFVGGELYQTSLQRYPLQKIPDETLAEWAAYGDRSQATDVDGRMPTALGKARYRVEAISFGDETGAFVVAYLPVAELREIEDVRTYGLVTSLAGARGGDRARVARRRSCPGATARAHGHGTIDIGVRSDRANRGARER